MLVSHLKKFIFIKSIKTAGTSVESYFERYCMPEGEWSQTHYRDQYVNSTGIIGYRGANRGDSTFYNHMPASQIKELIGNNIWHDYFKFTIVRNPYDKMISAFYFFKKLEMDPSIKSSGDDIADFKAWMTTKKSSLDKHLFTIDGNGAMDFYIRYENLHNDLVKVCSHLEIDFKPEYLPDFKKGFRGNKHSILDFYDNETIERIKDIYKYEIETFGYELPV